MTVYKSHMIAVKHNIEVAHRLFELPGKCEQIHGHSMWVTMKLQGELNEHGILGGIEYGDLKKVFREYLDETFDHRLLLNAADPFAHPLYTIVGDEQPGIRDGSLTLKMSESQQVFLPGLQAVPGDPTTENISLWVAQHMADVLTEPIEALSVEVWETSVNMATTFIEVEEV